MRCVRMYGIVRGTVQSGDISCGRNGFWLDPLQTISETARAGEAVPGGREGIAAVAARWGQRDNRGCGRQVQRQVSCMCGLLGGGVTHCCCVPDVGSRTRTRRGPDRRADEHQSPNAKGGRRMLGTHYLYYKVPY